MDFNITEFLQCYDTEAFKTVEKVFFALFIPACVFGNGLILISVYRFSFLRTKTHTMIANLAVADLLVGVSLLMLVFDAIYPEEVANIEGLCIFIYCLIVTSITMSVANLLNMSLERLMSLVFPLKHRAYFTKRKMYIGITLAWIAHIVFGFLPLFGWNTYTSEYKLCIKDLIWPKEFIILITADILFGLVGNTIVYTLIVYIAIRSSKRLSSSIAVSVTKPTKTTLKTKTKMTLFVFGAFAICWLPFTVVSILVLVADSAELRCLLHLFVSLGVLNSSTNWAIYGLTNAKFKRAFKTLLRCKCCDKDKRITSLSSLSVDSGVNRTLETPPTRRKY